MERSGLNPSGFRQKYKRESSNLVDENMNYATPLINAHEPKIYRKALNSSFLTGNFLYPQQQLLCWYQLSFEGKNSFISAVVGSS